MGPEVWTFLPFAFAHLRQGMVDAWLGGREYRANSLSQLCIFDLPRGHGVRATFMDMVEAGKVDVGPLSRDLRADAHAARCYAQACDKIADLAELGQGLDARPVRVGGGLLEMEGADALAVLSFYFGVTDDLSGGNF